jgi:hypothetical protein
VKEDCIGSQVPQWTVMIEEEEEMKLLIRCFVLFISYIVSQKMSLDFISTAANSQF